MAFCESLVWFEAVVVMGMLAGVTRAEQLQDDTHREVDP